MSSALTENAANASFSVGLQAPDVGVDFLDECNTVRAALQQLSDRDQLLYKLTGLVPLGATPASGFRLRVPLAPYVLSGATAHSYLSGSGSVRIALGTGGATAHFPLPSIALPKIYGYGMKCLGQDPSGGPYTVLPTTAASIKLIRQPYAAGGALGTAVVVDTTSDPQPTLAALNTEHEVTKTGLTHTIVTDSTYQLAVVGPTGGTGGGYSFYQLWVDVGL